MSCSHELVPRCRKYIIVFILAQLSNCLCKEGLIISNWVAKLFHVQMKLILNSYSLFEYKTVQRSTCSLPMMPLLWRLMTGSYSHSLLTILDLLVVWKPRESLSGTLQLSTSLTVIVSCRLRKTQNVLSVGFPCQLYSYLPKHFKFIRKIRVYTPYKWTTISALKHTCFICRLQRC